MEGTGEAGERGGAGPGGTGHGENGGGARGVTRLAPSPTGALHLGNARTFVVNWALARQRGWKVVLRIEDLDTPRVKAGAAEATLAVLGALGLDWDEGPVVQSELLAADEATGGGYIGAMEKLSRAGLVYASPATRGELEEGASAPQEGARESVFPAARRPAWVAGAWRRSAGENWRLATPTDGRGRVEFVDALRGRRAYDVAEVVGDFVVWTKRDQPAYQLAVVVDDARQGVTEVVRGDDLLDSAARQLLVYRALGWGPEPRYWHVPLVRGADGRRLAKRHGDSRIETYLRGGVSAGRIWALLARWSGVECGEEMGAAEFVRRFDIGRLPMRDVVYTAEDEAWLWKRGG